MHGFVRALLATSRWFSLGNRRPPDVEDDTELDFRSGRAAQRDELKNRFEDIAPPRRSIRHSRAQVEQRAPELSGLAAADEVGGAVPVEFLVLGHQPAADFLRLHQFLKLIENGLEFAQPGRIDGADGLALFPIHQRAIRAIHHAGQLGAAPTQRLAEPGQRLGVGFRLRLAQGRLGFGGASFYGCAHEGRIGQGMKYFKQYFNPAL